MGIIFSKSAMKQLEKLNPRFQQKIIFTLEKFKKGMQIDIIKMKNSDCDFRIRAGNYRIQIEKVDEGFLVTKIGKRENFYGVFI